MNNILTHFAANTGMNGVSQLKNVGNSDADLQSAVVNIINAVIGILAVVCVLIIIIGGVNYMTSSGDAGKVKKAKDIILYGVIGMIVCVLAFAITNFIIANVLKAA